VHKSFEDAFFDDCGVGSFGAFVIYKYRHGAEVAQSVVRKVYQRNQRTGYFFAQIVSGD
jgi:hypothetical protein